VSAVTLAEIRFGIEASMTWRGALNAWLENKRRPQFGGLVLPVSEDVILKWRLMEEAERKAGLTYSQPDLIIAATALHHGLTVVSRDAAEFRRARVPVINPWQ
jgi:predicted nucleic acid-binding protein